MLPAFLLQVGPFPLHDAGPCAGTQGDQASPPLPAGPAPSTYRLFAEVLGSPLRAAPCVQKRE